MWKWSILIGLLFMVTNRCTRNLLSLKRPRVAHSPLLSIKTLFQPMMLLRKSSLRLLRYIFLPAFMNGELRNSRNWNLCFYSVKRDVTAAFRKCYIRTTYKWNHLKREYVAIFLSRFFTRMRFYTITLKLCNLTQVKRCIINWTIYG